MEIVRIVICLSVFLFSYSAFSQDYRFVREVKQREPALERSIRKWRWKERDSRQLHCYEMQYTGHGITSANLSDLSFLDSLIFMGDHRGHPCAVTYVEESGRLAGMPRNCSEGRRGYLQLMEGYKKILEKGNGGFLFCLSRMRLPCWLYFVLDNEGNLYGIDMEAYGVAVAASSLGTKWFVAKGVQDYADGNKSSTEEDGRTFAAYVSAILVGKIITDIVPSL